MLIDTHAHLNFNAFKEDVDKVIKRALEKNIWIINVGSQYDTSQKAIAIAQQYEKGVFAAVGLHPLHLEKTEVDKSEIENGPVFETRAEEFDYEKYKALAQSSDKVIAIGETGLDYWHQPKDQLKIKQKKTLLQHLDLAQELDLPVIFHCRVAFKDLIITIKQRPSTRGVIHCFTGDWEQAQELLKMGFYLGFNGIIFNLNLDEVILKTPLEKILVETDSPYLSPQKGQRNEPLFINQIIDRIAHLKKIDSNELGQITTQNAQQLFKI